MINNNKMINDRVKGLIFGKALGDAVGAYFEFRSQLMISKDFASSEDIVFPPPKNKQNVFKRDRCL